MEEGDVRELQLETFQPSNLFSSVMCFEIAGLGHLLQSMSAEQTQVYRGRQHHQALIGADVGAGLFTFDVLLARVEGGNVTALATAVDRFADQAARQATYIFLFCRQDAEVRPAKRQRDAERLAVARDYVSAEFCRGGYPPA